MVAWGWPQPHEAGELWEHRMTWEKIKAAFAIDWEKAKADMKKALKGLVLLACAWVVIAYLGSYGASYQGWLAFIETVDVKNVTVMPKPHDCEWDTPPLGNKHCHYDDHRFRLNPAGNPALLGNTGPNDKIVVSWEKVNE
jgi:hypothetical protein